MDLPPNSNVEDSIPRRIETKDTLLKKYDIPINHLDFSYVAKCNDGKELERILHILQSGEEGYYPQLLSATEERLMIIKPNSKFIRKRTPVIDRNCLDKQTRASLDDEINDFVQYTSQYDSKLSKFKQNEENAYIPSVRSVSSINLETPITYTKKSSRIKATDYASWDKYDPDTEMLKMDLEIEKIKKAQDRGDKEKEKIIKSAELEVDYDGYTETEANIQSTQERLKGNEFYKAGDYSEALACYTKSIHINPSIEAYNNRAQVQIMLKNYKFAMIDSQEALKYDSYNIKANMRLAQCLRELSLYEKSIRHLETVISVDPNNINAQNLLNSVRSKLSKSKCSVASPIEEPRRLTITEVSSSETVSSTAKTTNKRKSSFNNIPPKEKQPAQVLVPIPGPSHMEEPYYIAVDEDDPEMIKRVQLMLYNRPQLMYICHPDDSDTDDYSDSPRDYDIKKSSCRKGTSLGEINQRIEDFTRSKTQYNRNELSSDEEINSSKMSVQWPNVDTSRKSSVEIFEVVTSDDDIGNSHNKDHVKFDNGKSNKSEKSEESYEYEDEDLEDAFTGEEMDIESNADEPTYVNDNNNNQDSDPTNTNEVKGGGGEPHLDSNQSSVNSNEIIRTPYSFLRAWTALPTEYSYVQHATVLRNLNENRLSAVIGNKLDGRMLTDILRTLYMHFTVPHEVDRVYTIMTNLVALPRFKVIFLFLSAQDSVMVGSLFEFLEQHGMPLPDHIKCAYS